MKHKMCEKCGRKSMDIGCRCGEGQPKFKRLIMLCEDCFEKWGRLWIKSRIADLNGEEYHNAYNKLFWNWFNRGKEIVQFS